MSVARPTGTTLELLWNERTIDTTGPVHHVTIPVLTTDLPSSLSSDLTQLLSDWWTRPFALSETGTVTSVLAVFQRGQFGDHSLQLVLSTDVPIDAADLVGMRMVRDLRRAIRNLRLTRFAALGPSAELTAIAA